MLPHDAEHLRAYWDPSLDDGLIMMSALSLEYVESCIRCCSFLKSMSCIIYNLIFVSTYDSLKVFSYCPLIVGPWFSYCITTTNLLHLLFAIISIPTYCCAPNKNIFVGFVTRTSVIAGTRMVSPSWFRKSVFSKESVGRD